MARLSNIQRLPKDVQERIGELRQAGRTIDEILEALLGDGVIVARSTLGRHVKSLDELGARLRESAAAADALVRPLAEAGEDRLMRALVASMQSMMMDALAAKAGEDVQFDAEEFMFFARGLKDLGTARKADAELTTKLVERAQEKARKDAAGAVEKAGAAHGLSRETVEQLKAQIMGVSK